MDNFGISSATRSSLLALNSLQDQSVQLQKRISSGKRVNDPTDDPAAYFLAAGLTSRATAISGLMGNITNVQSAITAANKGVTAIQALVTSAQNIANQALASPIGSVTVTGNSSPALTLNTKIATSAGAPAQFKAGDTVTVSDGTTTATYTAANNDTVQTFINAVNNTANIKVTATLSSSGQIQLAGNTAITIGGTTTGAGTLTSVIGLTAATTSPTTNSFRSSLAAQFDALRAQIDSAAQDSNYNGVNFLNGSSTSVALNETGTAKMTVTGSAATSNALGLAASTNSFQTDTDVNAALSNVTKALNSLQSISGSIGSQNTVLQTRSDFNKALVEMLNNGATDLTANDMTYDSAALASIQAKQQLAASSLSLTAGTATLALRILTAG